MTEYLSNKWPLIKEYIEALILKLGYEVDIDADLSVDYIIIGVFVLLLFFVFLRMYFARRKNKKNKTAPTKTKTAKKTFARVKFRDDDEAAQPNIKPLEQQPKDAPDPKSTEVTPSDEITSKDTEPPPQDTQPVAPEALKVQDEPKASDIPEQDITQQKKDNQPTQVSDLEIAQKPLDYLTDQSIPTKQRIKAIEEVGTQKIKEALPKLLNLLYDPESAISIAAADSLVSIGDERAIEPLIEVTKANDKRLMTQLGKPDNLDETKLSTGIDSTSPPASPFNFKESIRFRVDKLPEDYFMPDGSTIPRTDLVLKGLKDKNQQLRQMAAKAAIGLDSEEIIEPLMETLSNPTEVDSVRFMVAEALGGIQDDRTIDSLLKALQDNNVAVRYSAAAALNGRKDPRVVEALVDALNDTDPYVKSSVAYSLGSTASDIAMEALFDAVADECEIVRFSAIKALANFPTSNVVERVLAGLNDSDKNQRLAMLDILGEINDASSAKILKKYLYSEDTEISYRASMALMGQENLEVIDELVEASRKFDKELMKLVNETKSTLEEFQQEEPLTQDTDETTADQKPQDDEQPSVQKIIPKAKVAGSKKSSSLFKSSKSATDITDSLAKLKQDLNSDDPSIRGKASITLGDYSSFTAVELLTEALKDENKFVRSSAVTSLAKINDFGALKIILECEKDPSEEVRYSLVKALAKILDPEAQTCLQRMSTNDSSKSVKRSARLAVGGAAPPPTQAPPS